MTFAAVTFDYFGTLVDADRGGTLGMAAVLERLGSLRDPATEYLRWDQRAVRIYRGGKYRPYRAVARLALADTLQEVATESGAQASLDELTDVLLAGLVEASPPHPEVVRVLELLGQKYPLMPITNMDTELFRRSQLAACFPRVITAQMAEAYKPSERIFLAALAALGVDAEQVLHASLSPFADIDGAKPLGFAVAWINRGAERLGTWSPTPDYELPDLGGLPRILGL